MRSLYIFPIVACDARHLGHRSQGALLGVVESVGCGSQHGMTWGDRRAQAPRPKGDLDHHTSDPDLTPSPRQRTAMDEWPVICWPDTLDLDLDLDTEAPTRLDRFWTTTQTLP